MYSSLFNISYKSFLSGQIMYMLFISMYLKALQWNNFIQTKKASKTCLVSACVYTVRVRLFKSHSSYALSPLVISPLPLHFLKWRLWFMNHFTMTLSCFLSRSVVFAYILRMAKPICFFLNFCQLKLLSVLFSAWGL